MAGRKAGLNAKKTKVMHIKRNNHIFKVNIPLENVEHFKYICTYRHDKKMNATTYKYLEISQHSCFQNYQNVLSGQFY